MPGIETTDAFDPQATLDQLNSIVALIKSKDSEGALQQIAALVSELQRSAEPRTGGDNPAPAPARVIAAHLKAAEAQIQATHLAPAQESLEKAVYIVVHGASPLTEGTVQLNL